MGSITVFHADSLAKPMAEFKQAFERIQEDAIVQLVSGRSKELAEQIIAGKCCDVAAFSDPRVIQEVLIEQSRAAWYLVFSTNELVLITGKENRLP